MSLKKAISFTIVILALISCDTEDVRLTLVEDAIKTVKREEFFSKRAILIIPNGGCDGCITAVEQFVTDNLQQYPELLVVFTSTQSQKSLRLRMGDFIYNHKNVFIDKNNHFYTKELISEYPTIVYIENRKPTKVQYQSPEEPIALETLQVYLDSE